MGLKSVAKRAPVVVTFKKDPTIDTDALVFVADRDYEVISVSEAHSATDAAATLDVKRVASGGASITGGTSVLASTFDLGTTALTPVVKSVVNGGVSGTLSTRIVQAGEQLGLDFGGTLNTTSDACVTIVLSPVTGS